MRLSLMKAAHVALFGAAYRKYGYLPGFGRCGIPRPSTPRNWDSRISYVRVMKSNLNAFP
jgi:hypothetical protein